MATSGALVGDSRPGDACQGRPAAMGARARSGRPVQAQGRGSAGSEGQRQPSRGRGPGAALQAAGARSSHPRDKGPGRRPWGAGRQQAPWEQEPARGASQEQPSRGRGPGTATLGAGARHGLPGGAGRGQPHCERAVRERPPLGRGPAGGVTFLGSMPRSLIKMLGPQPPSPPFPGPGADGGGGPPRTH